MIATQLALAAALWAMAGVSPRGELALFGLLAVAVAFLSASQDAVYDAYRSDLLPPRERGMGASLNTMGYRMAMIVSGGRSAGQGPSQLLRSSWSISSPNLA